jgi:DNA-binding protein YbaB
MDRDGADWLAHYRRRAAEIGARARSAQNALADVEGTAESRDGAVAVTVTPSGALRGLVLSERSTRMSRTELAATVLATAREAQAEAARRTEAALAPLIGDDTEAMRVLRSHLAGTP